MSGIMEAAPIKRDGGSASGVIETNQLNCDELINLVMNAKGTHQSPLIPRIPPLLHVDTKTFKKNYEPRVISLGPYHFGKAKLQTLENLKPKIAKKFVSEESHILKDLYNKVFKLCRDSALQTYYEENSSSTNKHLTTDIEAFARMMLLDGCFILYYIECVWNSWSGNKKPTIDELEMKSHDIVLVQQDMFLHENQLPFCVLKVVLDARREFWNTSYMSKIDIFVKNFLGHYSQEKFPEIGFWRDNLSMMKECFCMVKEQLMKNRTAQKPELTTQKSEMLAQTAQQDPLHLLQHLHNKLVGKKIKNVNIKPAGTTIKCVKPTSTTIKRFTFRNVDELWGAGIYVRPTQSYELTAIKYVEGSIWTYLELPRITVDDSTRAMFMNLIAYEMCWDSNNESWVTSYICFLDSLIDHKEDVKILRSQEILHNCLGSDEEVSHLFNDIGYDLVPSPTAYEDVRNLIQKHYEQKCRRNMAEFRHEYFRTPWSCLALFGALVALFLSGVQAYFSVWSLPSDCEGLCKYIRKTHHL